MSEQVPAEAVKAAQEAISQALAEDWHETWLESDDALARTALEAGAPFIRADERARIADERLASVNRQKLEARLHAMGLPADQVYMVLVLADEYGAYLIEKHARPPMRQRRGMPGCGDAQREWQDSQGPTS